MSLGALEPQFWSAFCRAVGREELIKEQFASGERGREVMSEVEAIFAGRTRDEWVEFLKDVDCCCEPVNNFEFKLLGKRKTPSEYYPNLELGETWPGSFRFIG